MAEVAGKLLGVQLAYEISIANVDKPPLDFIEIDSRLTQFAASDAVWLTRAPLFVEKAELFPNTTFVVGCDTIERIGQLRYYEGRASAREAAIEQIAAHGCRFLVFGRETAGKFQTLGDLEIPSSLAALCQEVPESVFRQDISSTELRRQPARGVIPAGDAKRAGTLCRQRCSMQSALAGIPLVNFVDGPVGKCQDLRFVAGNSSAPRVVAATFWNFFWSTSLWCGTNSFWRCGRRCSSRACPRRRRPPKRPTRAATWSWTLSRGGRNSDITHEAQSLTETKCSWDGSACPAATAYEIKDGTFTDGEVSFQTVFERNGNRTRRQATKVNSKATRSKAPSNSTPAENPCKPRMGSQPRN